MSRTLWSRGGKSSDCRRGRVTTSPLREDGEKRRRRNKTHLGGYAKKTPLPYSPFGKERTGDRVDAKIKNVGRGFFDREEKHLRSIVLLRRGEYTGLCLGGERRGIDLGQEKGGVETRCYYTVGLLRPLDRGREVIVEEAAFTNGAAKKENIVLLV